jgi:hypothetical protein
MVIMSLKDLPDDGGGGGGANTAGGPVDGEKLPTDFMGIYHEKQVHGACTHALTPRDRFTTRDTRALSLSRTRSPHA